MKIKKSKGGWFQLDPLPSQSALDEKYQSGDFFDPEWLDKEFREHSWSLWDSFYRWQVDKATPLINLIDVGAGAGHFVDYWNEKIGFGVGVEPDNNLISPHRYIYNSLDEIEKYKFVKQGRRNLIRFSLVLEHVVDPHLFLIEWLKQVKVERIMVIVPNEFNPLQDRIMLKDSYKADYEPWFISEWHVNYFDPESLKECLRLAGVKNIKIYATFPMELFVLLGLDYRGNERLGRLCHGARLWLEKFFGPRIFDFYTWLHHKYGWGREIIAVGDIK